MVRVVVHRHGHLRRQHDVVAAALERLADDLLGLAGGVDVGGVDEVDPGVQRAVDDADRVVVVGVAPGAEHHRAEAELRDLDAGASERAVVHGVVLGVVDDLRVRLQAELRGVGAAAHALVERVDRRDLLGGQREVEDVEVLGDAVRLDRLGIAQKPCSMCQRRTTCAGVLPYLAARSVMTGSVSGPRDSSPPGT